MSAEFAEAFTEALAEMPQIGKDKTADMGNYSYKYADLNTILEAVKPVLAKHGLTVAQSTVNIDSKVGVETRIYHESGHVETFGPLVLPAGNNAQGYGSAITYARRYSLTAALGIAPDEDDDGAEAVKAQQAPQRKDVEPDPADWLAQKVEIFGLWTKEQRVDAYKAATHALEPAFPLSQADAEKVFGHMADAYYEEHPSSDERPF